MPGHPAEVFLRDGRVKALKSARLIEFATPRLNLGGELLNLRDMLDSRSVVVTYIDIPSVRSQHGTFETLQLLLVSKEPEHHGFEACRARIILFVGIRWRAKHEINGVRFNLRSCAASIDPQCSCASGRKWTEVFQVDSDSLGDF